jgi:hypothetical protein
VIRAFALRFLLGAGIVAGCAGLFFACFERREVLVETGVSSAVRRNKYVAMARLLRGMGHEVQVHDDVARLGRLPDPPATVFLPVQRHALGERRTQALLDWVARGGHLVVTTYTVWGPPERANGTAPDAAADVIVNGRPDALLDRFGLRQRMWSEEERASATALAAIETLQPEGLPPPTLEEEPAAGEEPGGAEGELAPEPASEGEEDEPPPSGLPSMSELLSGEWQPGSVEASWAYLEAGEPPLEIEFHEGFWWDDTEELATWAVGGEAGPHLVEVEHGEGTITALTSDEPFANATIGRVQNAEFIVRWLRHGRDERVPVWIFYEATWPSLFALLRRHALPALVAGAAFLALWLWRSLPRFGPALPAPDPARRRWLEHLEAAGRFHWRQDHGRALLAAERADLMRVVRRLHPAWARASERERNERLAHASGLDVSHVAHALASEPRGAKSFVVAVRTLERIRAAL